jgi:hypothetical protein
MTDAPSGAAPGKGWSEWFRILDAWGSTKRSHWEIARYLRSRDGVGGWWAQTVTVGYERARGMRAPRTSAPTASR